MRVPKAAWLAQLRRLDGCAEADIRYNESVARWEFILRGADGIPRSQFFGQFYTLTPGGRQVPLSPDPVTGLHAFRELDDHAMQEVLANLEKTFVGNRHDGAGTVRRQVIQNYRENKAAAQKHYHQAAEQFADMVQERSRRIRGAPLVSVPVQVQ